MARADRARWDQRYAAPRKSLNKGPNDWLLAYAPRQNHARALELACGLGHNALWLAEQGYTVDAIDISLVALRLARGEMKRRGLSGVNFIVADLDHFVLPGYAYDLVCVFRFLNRGLFPALRARVRPGGLVIYQSLNIRHLERAPDCSPAHMLQIGELSSHFPGWTVLAASDDGNLGALVARKPE